MHTRATVITTVHTAMGTRITIIIMATTFMDMDITSTTAQDQDQDQESRRPPGTL